MRLLVLLPLLGLALSAPVQEDQAEDKSIEKRAAERLGFGNQQNLPKIKKKSDPFVAALPDEHGSVQAEEPQEVIATESDEGGDNQATNIEQELSDIIREEAMPKQQTGADVVDTENEAEADNSLSSEGEQAEINEPLAGNEAAEPVVEEMGVDGDENAQQDIPPENSQAIQELMEQNMANAEIEGDNENNQLIATSDDQPETTNPEEDQETLELLGNPYKAYDLYRTYQKILSSYPMYYRDSYARYPNGRRRRATSALLSRLRNQEIKRSHRIKRDLPYVDDSFLPYLFPEVEEDPYYRVPEQEIDNQGFELFPEDEIEQELAEEDIPYEEEDDNGTPIMFDGQMGYFVPSKRQDMLSFVPGNKRDSYFYPFSREPQTHFRAFVPQKRGYLDSYEDLVRLARILAMQPEGRDEYMQGYEWE